MENGNMYMFMIIIIIYINMITCSLLQVQLNHNNMTLSEQIALVSFLGLRDGGFWKWSWNMFPLVIHNITVSFVGGWQVLTKHSTSELLYLPSTSFCFSYFPRDWSKVPRNKRGLLVIYLPVSWTETEITSLANIPLLKNSFAIWPCF